MKYENPPNKSFVKLVVVVFIVMSSIGVLMLLLKKGLWDGWSSPLILMGIGGGFLLQTWFREYLTTPKSVEIRDDGLILEMTYSGTRAIRWDEIIGFFSNPDEEAILDSGHGVGSIFLIRGPRLWTTYQISRAVAIKYRIVNGKELPEKRLGEKVGDFKKRISRNDG